MTITIKGREYQVEEKPCPDERVVYYVTGKYGHRWFTLRNQQFPDMMFLMPEKGTSQTMKNVWLTDRSGKLEVAEK